MSADAVDDIEAAEEAAGALAASLHHALHVDVETEGWWGNPAWTEATAALEDWQSYCRPRCQGNGVLADCQAADPELCGCPCHSRQDGPSPALGAMTHPEPDSGSGGDTEADPWAVGAAIVPGHPLWSVVAGWASIEATLTEWGIPDAESRAKAIVARLTYLDPPVILATAAEMRE